ncbi:MAG: hypothetical protein PWQ22_362 [Archaeoglobaceae archaeon]|nr:hypothetical protein [Archaeoglobaceae archaeon]
MESLAELSEAIILAVIAVALITAYFVFLA